VAGPLAGAAAEIARELARAGEPAAVRERLEKARGLARGKKFAEKALAGASALLEGIEDRAPGERFERLDLVLDALDAVAQGEERPALLETIERCLAGPRSEPAAAPGTAPGPDSDPLEALELLSGEIVQISGPTDAAGFQAVEHAARDLQALVMKAGGGSHALLDALEALADLAARASRGEVPSETDTRAVLSAAATALPPAVKGEVAAATKVLEQLRSVLETKRGTTEAKGTIILPPPGMPRAPLAPLAAVPKTGPVTVSLGADRAILDGFVLEAREHLANAEGQLLALERNPGDPGVVNDLFRAFHSIKGVAGLLALTPVVHLTHALESLLDAARKGTRTIDRASIDALLAARDALGGGVDAVAGALERGNPETTIADPTPLIATLEGILTGKAPPVPVPDRAPPSPAPEPLPTTPTASLPRAATLAATSAPAAHSGVRVPMERLDSLVALVGEMVISQAQVGHDLSATNDPDAPLVKETNRLGKITREVQDLSMTLRMLPVQPLFQKLQRLVRDLVRTTGKLVRLETDGEETRLDKSVIDELEDPLVHMVRNAIDHGIESPEERRAAQKPEQGTIRVSACHAGGEVVIEIQDDGKGLDRDRILAKARERGLAPLDSVPADPTIFGYIFEPGLSTAQKVTELSGRGVGMDVVKKNITKLRGKIEIDSQRGRGTRFTVKLPLTLAIIDGMIVRVEKERFTLPNFAIEEALQLKPGQLITAYGKGEMVRIRGALIPFLRLKTVFGLEGAEPEGLAVIVEAAGERMALGVDEILGQQQIVIKSLEPPFNEVPAIGGATVLGDGRVGLILDPAKLMALALRGEKGPAPVEMAPEPPRREHPLEGKYLVAALGAEEYGLPVLSVQEIVTLLPVTAIPLVAPFVEGAVNLRGHVIPVVDLRARLGMPSQATEEQAVIVVVRLPGRTLGLRVDSVREVLNLRRDATAAPPRFAPGFRADFILGVGASGDRVVFLLDTERVLAARELITGA
jgi:two-component system chemotaxis sensor kinase CheA